MRNYLFIALLFSSLITSAQTFVSSGNCQAAFKYEVNNKLMSPIAGTAINFYDHSVGNVKFWFWDFGDGTTSNEQNPKCTCFPFPFRSLCKNESLQNCQPDHSLPPIHARACTPK